MSARSYGIDMELDRSLAGGEGAGIRMAGGRGLGFIWQGEGGGPSKDFAPFVYVLCLSEQ